MSARLVPLKPGTAPTIPVQRPVVMVGRHPESDVRLDLPKISRRHCCVALAYDRIVIRDLGSRNGLWVNGLRIEETELHFGDEVAIGPLLFRVESLNLAEVPGASGIVPHKPPSLPELPVVEDEDSADSDDDLIPIDF